MRMRLCDEGAGSGALVSPGWWENTDGLVVAGETVDSGLDQNEAELAVLVLSVALEVLADGDGLLDEHVKVLWDLWCEAVGLQDTEDLVTSDDLDLSDTVAVTEDDTNLRWGGTLLRELADLVNDLVGSGLEPCWYGARVWNGAVGDTLSLGVKTTHDCGAVGDERMSRTRDLS